MLFPDRSSPGTVARGGYSLRGYTLLEILVVLLLLGLIAGLALPRLSTGYDRLRAALQRDDVGERISDLGYRAFSEGRSFELIAWPAPADSRVPLELPDGWRLETQQPIRYRGNGTCSGGELRLVYGSFETRVRLEAPLCRFP